MARPAFIDDRATARAIRELAAADALTIFVGAGASMESALPSWSELIARMLNRVASPHGLDDTETAMFRTLTTRTDGVTGAGAVVKAALGPRFKEELRRALYAGSDGAEPGQTAIGAARLRLHLEAGELVTTNYDDLLERALEREKERRAEDGRAGFAPGDLVVRATSRHPARSKIAVHHLHGYLTPTDFKGEVVLSEEDYVRMQGQRTWQEEEFMHWLRTSTCLFVGTSLTDTNLLRYLYLVPAERRHYAVFVRQADESLVDQAVPARVRQAREQTAGKRWSKVKVTPLYADFYSESAQLLFEVVQRRELGNHQQPYGKRMAAWRDALARTTLPNRNPAFNVAQDQLQAQLSDLVCGVREVCEEAGVTIPDDEPIMTGLWVRTAERELTLWASSDRAWRDPGTLEPVPITVDSPWASVQAMCTGSLVTRSTAQDTTTRWNHVVAIPVYLDGSGGGRMPVGAVTLASKRGVEDSVWARAGSALQSQLAVMLAEVGGQLLEPTS